MSSSTRRRQDELTVTEPTGNGWLPFGLPDGTRQGARARVTAEQLRVLRDVDEMIGQDMTAVVSDDDCDPQWLELLAQLEEARFVTSERLGAGEDGAPGRRVGITPPGDRVLRLA